MSRCQITGTNFMKKILTAVFLAAMALCPCFLNAQNSSDGEYVDLGLPSGTKWKSTNEGFYSYDDAITKFGSKMPSIWQWEELRKECEWSWTRLGIDRILSDNTNTKYQANIDTIYLMGYRVVGPNGNFIDLPANGICIEKGYIDQTKPFGYYWVCTNCIEYPEIHPKFIFFNSESLSEVYGNKNLLYTVHLVQK